MDDSVGPSASECSTESRTQSPSAAIEILTVVVWLSKTRFGVRVRVGGMSRGVRRACRIGFVAAYLAVAIGSSSARADSTHYQTLQLGERSRGMAAAYTGFAADGAAIWYNPAGLPFLEPRLLQGSLSLIQSYKLSIQGAIVSDGPDGVGGEDQVEDFELKSSPSLPGFAVASFALGKRKESLDNRKALQIAISAFQTYNAQFGGDININDEFGRTSSLQFYQTDHVTYFGAGIGYRPIRNFSFGFTLLAGNRQLQHVETTSLVIGGAHEPYDPFLCRRRQPSESQHGVHDELVGSEPTHWADGTSREALAPRVDVSATRVACGRQIGSAL